VCCLVGCGTRNALLLGTIKIIISFRVTAHVVGAFHQSWLILIVQGAANGIGAALSSHGVVNCTKADVAAEMLQGSGEDPAKHMQSS
jgi:hypothetical protein